MSKTATIFGHIIRILLPVCLLAVGLWGYSYFKSQETKVKRRPPVRPAMLVETIRMEPGDFNGVVRVMGTVVPDRQVSLKARVAGEIVYLSNAFVRGGVVKKSDVLVKLDDADYTIEVAKAQSALEKTQSDLKLELGNQKIAEEEFKLISKISKNKVAATDLALRKPQLEQAQAAVDSARADLDKAELALSRTIVRVPFNSLVLEKHVDMGSLITAQEPIAVLVNTDTFHIEALVPPDQLQALDFSDGNSASAVIRSPYSELAWKGRVIRTTGRISAESRMAGVLVAVDDPLGLTSGLRPLMLDDHVFVDIQGKRFKQVYKVPRALLRDGDTVWINSDGRLDIRKVEVAWKQDETVFISKGLYPEDEIIVTDLPAPVRGMALQNGKENRS